MSARHRVARSTPRATVARVAASDCFGKAGRTSARGRNCKFAAAPDSGDSARMYRNGRSVDGRVRQLDPFQPVTPVATVAHSWTSRAFVSGQPGDTTITSTRLVGRLPVQVPKHPADAGADRSIA